MQNIVLNTLILNHNPLRQVELIQTKKKDLESLANIAITSQDSNWGLSDSEVWPPKNCYYSFCKFFRIRKVDIRIEYRRACELTGIILLIAFIHAIKTVAACDFLLWRVLGLGLAGVRVSRYEYETWHVHWLQEHKK